MIPLIFCRIAIKTLCLIEIELSSGQSFRFPRNPPRQKRSAPADTLSLLGRCTLPFQVFGRGVNPNAAPAFGDRTRLGELPVRFHASVTMAEATRHRGRLQRDWQRPECYSVVWYACLRPGPVGLPDNLS
jgi:hypothetical protein